MNFISLDKSANYWSKEILNNKLDRNKQVKEELIKHNFEIKNEAKNLISLYERK